MTTQRSSIFNAGQTFWSRLRNQNELHQQKVHITRHRWLNKAISCNDQYIFKNRWKVEIIRLRQNVRYLTQSYDKSLYTHRKFHKSNVTTQKRHQNFDYTTTADRLSTISLSHDRLHTGVVKPVSGIPTFPLTTKLFHLKDTHLKICNYSSL